jgi:F-type H+-transporting ATPase subunit b
VQLEIGLIISQILAFLIMLWILKRFAWKPLLKILKERQEKIQAAFASIEEGKKEIQSLKELYNSKLEKIEEQAKEKITEAILSGQQMAQHIQEEAHNSAKAILQKAQGDIANEMLKAQAELKNNLINTVILATQKFIKEKIDTEKDKQLIGEFVEEAQIKE